MSNSGENPRTRGEDGVRLGGGLHVDGQPGGVGRRSKRGRHCQVPLQRAQGILNHSEYELTGGVGSFSKNL